MEQTDGSGYPSTALVYHHGWREPVCLGGVVDMVHMVEKVVEYLRTCPRYNETSSRHVYPLGGRMLGIEWDAREILKIVREYDLAEAQGKLEDVMKKLSYAIWLLDKREGL